MQASALSKYSSSITAVMKQNWSRSFPLILGKLVDKATKSSFSSNSYFPDKIKETEVSIWKVGYSCPFCLLNSSGWDELTDYFIEIIFSLLAIFFIFWGNVLKPSSIQFSRQIVHEIVIFWWVNPMLQSHVNILFITFLLFSRRSTRNQYFSLPPTSLYSQNNLLG